MQGGAEGGLCRPYLWMVEEFFFGALLCGSVFLSPVFNRGFEVAIAGADFDGAGDAEGAGNRCRRLFAVLCLIEDDAAWRGLQAEQRRLPTGGQAVFQQEQRVFVQVKAGKEIAPAFGVVDEVGRGDNRGGCAGGA